MQKSSSPLPNAEKISQEILTCFSQILYSREYAEAAQNPIPTDASVAPLSSPRHTAQGSKG